MLALACIRTCSVVSIMTIRKRRVSVGAGGPMLFVSGACALSMKGASYALNGSAFAGGAFPVSGSCLHDVLTNTPS
jgi:hypothetical protein